MIRLTMSTVALAMLAAGGCGFGRDQEVSGTVSRSTFPEAVTHVRAVGAASTVETRVASDGTFTLYLPEHDRYRIELLSAVRQSDLVFPRGAGVVDTSFYVEAARDTLELGGIRYIGDIGTASNEGGGTGEGDTGTGGEGDTGTGGEGDTGSGGEGDTGTGGEGDTGTGGGQDTGAGGAEGDGASCGDTVGEADGGSESGDAAIAEGDVPAEIGCGDGGGGEGDTGTGGQDTGTGGGE